MTFSDDISRKPWKSGSDQTIWNVTKFVIYIASAKILTSLPLRFRKAERVWCGGAPEPHWSTRYNGVTPRKTKEFLKSPCFFRS